MWPVDIINLDPGNDLKWEVAEGEVEVLSIYCWWKKYWKAYKLQGKDYQRKRPCSIEPAEAPTLKANSLVRLLAYTSLAVEKERPTIEIQDNNGQPKSLSLFVTNINELVNVLNAPKAQKRRGRIIAGRKSSIIRRLLRAKEKKFRIL